MEDMVILEEMEMMEEIKINLSLKRATSWSLSKNERDP